jgi:hypothetical protein
MSLLYFLPGLTRLDTLPPALAHVFGDAKPSWTIDGGGPGDGKGVLCGDARTLGPRGLSYDAEHQEWMLCNSGGGDGGSWWVGYDRRDGKPSPAELARKEQLPGKLTILGDGQAWRLPILRFKLSGDGWQPALPCQAVLTAEGAWGFGAVLPQYQELDQLAEELISGVLLPLFGEGAPLGVDQKLDALARLLAVNYRISRWEASLLGLLTLTDPPHYRSLDRLLGVAIDGERAGELIAGKLAASVASLSTAGAGG